MPRNNLQEEKPRISNDSSRASFSSSSCSSTFSSLDFNRTIQSEATAASNRFHDLRDVVKESMHREVRSLSIKPHNSGERRGTVMKHIDSPRPIKHSNELLMLHRFSYDGRELREANRAAAIKMKELPRFSLDSKTNSIKELESRLNQEPGSHNRRSSVVARLMGLEALPEAISRDERRSPPSQLSLTTDEHKQNQANYSPRVSLNNSIKKATAFSGQQDSSQESPKLASKSRKGAADALHQTSSVYGQIKKRITELELKKSGKDLRALKQILGSMEEKTTARTADQHVELTSRRRCSLEESCPHQNKKAFHQAKLQTPMPLRCPRCSSLNTRFRYLNNNSLSQPRHYCRSCKRQWTAGGKLRLIPIGGKTQNGEPTKSPSSEGGDSKTQPLQPPLSEGEQHTLMPTMVSQITDGTLFQPITTAAVSPSNYFSNQISCLNANSC